MKETAGGMPRQILRLPAVMARTGMSRSWLYEAVARGKFPRPSKIGRLSIWDASSIDAWIAERFAEPAPAIADSINESLQGVSPERPRMGDHR